jgi:hypothetical protein
VEERSQLRAFRMESAENANYPKNKGDKQFPFRLGCWDI